MSAILPTSTADLRARLLAQPDLTDADRAALVQLFDQQRRYGLVWEDKPEAVEETLREFLPVLKEVPERAINTQQTEVPQHTLIEGDNLHALTVLSYTHAAQVDVIYIDPPYNTGQHFRYNDNWVERDNPFRHSLWLSFISKRLKLAHTLLRETGVFIVHIDEWEFDALNVLLETQIFQEKNFLGVFIWNKKNPKGDANAIATMHEYVLCYAKNREEFSKLPNGLMRAKPNALAILKKAKRLFSKIGKVAIPDEVLEVIKPFNFPDTIKDEFRVKYDLELVNKEFQNWISKQDFSGGEKAYKFIDESGQVYQPVSMTWPNNEPAPEDYYLPLKHPITGEFCPVPSKGWRNPSATMQKLEQQKLIVFGNDHTTQPRRKYLLEQNMSENTPSIIEYGGSDDTFFKDLAIEFPYPKPVEVAKYLLKNVHPNPSLILDFFAGSGTTLHAVMALNAEDGGNRHSIMVTNNENNICEQVTYVRSRSVIQGYTTSNGLVVPGLIDNVLRYYKCVATVPRAPLYRHKRELVRRATDLLCLKEDCYQPLHGIPDGAEFMAFGSHRGATIIVYDDLAVEEAVTFIATLQMPKSAIVGKPWCAVYVFAAASYAYEDEFAPVADRVRLSALPEALYRAWQQLLPAEGIARSVAEVQTATVVDEFGVDTSDNSLSAASDFNGVPSIKPSAITPASDRRGNLTLF